jgi:membrane peptidoglycan carboxypeptidase
MVLAAAVAYKHADPKKTLYESKPLNIDNPTFGPIKVKTYDGSYTKTTSLWKATLRSDNAVYMQLDLDVGPKLVKRAARQMGITSPLQALPSEGLGGLREGVSPLEMARAYATLASDGWRARPIAITSVRLPDGTRRDPQPEARHRAFGPGVAATVTRVLRDNMLKGTGQAAQIGCPAAGKTGTTDDHKDAWFVGYTPRLATAVWVGYPRGKKTMESVHGIAVAGGTFPAQIWGDYMRGAAPCSEFKLQKSRGLQGYCGRRAVTKSLLCPAYRKKVEVRRRAERKRERQQAARDKQGSGGEVAPVDPLITNEDLPVPDITFDETPDDLSDSANAHFVFSSTLPAASYECRLDETQWEKCRSPILVRGLRPGDHVFEARAVGAQGDKGPTAFFAWQITE